MPLIPLDVSAGALKKGDVIKDDDGRRVTVLGVEHHSRSDQVIVTVEKFTYLWLDHSDRIRVLRPTSFKRFA